MSIRSEYAKLDQKGREYESFRAQRLVEESVKFPTAMHRINLKTFLSIHKPEKRHQKKVLLTKERFPNQVTN